MRARRSCLPATAPIYSTFALTQFSPLSQPIQWIEQLRIEQDISYSNLS
ncbi:hypothetical protein [Mesorhizobium waimense]|nr:hypothetical protein [Mesorhizobium waimense]